MSPHIAARWTALGFAIVSSAFASVEAVNEGWRFHHGDVSAAQAPAFDDSSWRVVDLPHDWSIEGPNGPASAKPPHDQTTPDGSSVGYLRGGVGWYRLHLRPSEMPDQRGAELVIDGAQQESDVWVNGTHVAFQPHGYIPLRVEIGQLIDPARDNVIAIRVLNPDANSRWYSGSGLYRGVSIRWHGPAFIPTWGAQVDTLWVKHPRAQLQVRVALQNDDAVGHDLTVHCRLTHPSGQVSDHALGLIRVAAHKQEALNATIELSNSATWEPETPRLYTADFTLAENDRTVDTQSTTFGVRTVGIDPARGFLLNGNPLKLRGACLHHDNGVLGAAAFPDAELRRVRLMKQNGFNAIRTSHNPPSAAFLDACDREGLLVVDEFTDVWELPKKLNGYQQYFDRHWEHDFGAMLQRDFNHPSVVIWSVGNEIPERFSPAGVRIARRLVDFVRQVDPRRPTTNAINSVWEDPNVTAPWQGNYPALEVLDIGGYNYAWRNYRSDHASAPHWVMVGTESYPGEAREIWQEVERLPYVIGDFVWTGMDYIGESGIAHATYIDANADPKSAGPKDWEQEPWPCWISWCGDLDLTGIKKPQSYYRDVVWGRSAVELAVHEPVPAAKQEKVGAWGWPAELNHWNWRVAKGTPLDVAVYSSARQIKLVLNGRTVGEAVPNPEQSITAKFSVPWEPGTLVAIASDGTREIGRRVLTTAGAPAALRAVAEMPTGKAARGTVVFVPIEVIDASGATVPDAALRLTCQVEGAGELQALGTGNPTAIESLCDSTTSTFRGHALAVVRSTGASGVATIKVSAPGVRDAIAKVEFKQ